MLCHPMLMLLSAISATVTLLIFVYVVTNALPHKSVKRAIDSESHKAPPRDSIDSQVALLQTPPSPPPKLKNPWERLRDAALGKNAIDDVVFTVSIVPAGMRVSSTPWLDGTRALSGPFGSQHPDCGQCAYSLESVDRALAWWNECLQQLSAKAKFVLIGEEKPSTMSPSSLEPYSHKHRSELNIGDVRLCAFDFSLEPRLPQGVLMYAYRHAPRAASTYQGLFVSPVDHMYLGNVYVNTNACFSGGNTADCFDFAFVLAHELGHALGLGHDCSDRYGVSEKGDWDGFFDCVDGAAQGTMRPSVTKLDGLPTMCGKWVRHHLREVYAGEHEIRALEQGTTPHTAYAALFMADGACGHKHTAVSDDF